MITKKKLLALIKALPENFLIDELLDNIMFLQKVEAGLEQSSKGNILSTKQAKAKLKKWLK
jgi:hypothetical protein